MDLQTIVYEYAQPVYDTYIRNHLPRVFGNYGGIAARDVRLLDFKRSFPNYKKGLMDAIKREIQPGDYVTLVGGGRGVSSVRIAEAGADKVFAYEASKDMISVAEETVAMAGYSDTVKFKHALIGDAIDVYGEYDSARVCVPEHFVSMERLVLDCEGAEKSILENLGSYPETVIVETHPEHGVTGMEISNILNRNGYRVHSYAYKPHNTEKRILIGFQN